RERTAENLPGDGNGSLGRGRYLDIGEIRHRQCHSVAPSRCQWRGIAPVLARDSRCLLQGGAGTLCRERCEESKVEDDLRALEEIPRRRARVVPGQRAAVRQLHAVEEDLTTLHRRGMPRGGRDAYPAACERSN